MGVIMGYGALRITAQKITTAQPALKTQRKQEDLQLKRMRFALLDKFKDVFSNTLRGTSDWGKQGHLS